MRRALAFTALLLSAGWSMAVMAQTQTQTAAAQSAPASAAPFGMPVNDEAVFAHLLVDQFEARLGDSSALRWDAQAWVGTDENRLYLLTEGENHAGIVTDGQQELLYDRPLSPFFDLRAGVRSDLDSASRRTWAALGFAGVAPYFVEVSATLYASDTGHYAARVTASYDLLLTQHLILAPGVELNAYSKAEPGRRVDSGLSGIDAGLRLRYEITRKFAPYLGVSYERGIARSDTRVALGVRAWL